MAHRSDPVAPVARSSDGPPGPTSDTRPDVPAAGTAQSH